MVDEMDYKEFNKKKGSVKEQIIEFLKDKPRNVNFLVDKLGVSQPRISIVLRGLYDEGVVDNRKVKNYVYYGLTKK